MPGFPWLLPRLHAWLHQRLLPWLLQRLHQQEQRAAAADFVDEFGVTYTVALDASGEVSAAYGVGRGMPISFLVSPGGVIEQVYFGRLTETQFAELEARLP